jgi:hypothetical protein
MRLNSSINKKVIHKYTFSDSSDERYSLQVFGVGRHLRPVLKKKFMV